MILDLSKKGIFMKLILGFILTVAMTSPVLAKTFTKTFPTEADNMAVVKTKSSSKKKCEERLAQILEKLEKAHKIILKEGSCEAVRHSTKHDSQIFYEGNTSYMKY